MINATKRAVACCFLLAACVCDGCHTASTTADPQWLTDFRRTNAILFEAEGREFRTTDVDSINRLREIYRKSDWSPYWHTLPGDIGDQTIYLLDGENKLRHFSYTGVLWESDSYTENRTSELTETDKDWIESMFSVTSETEPARQLELTPQAEHPTRPAASTQSPMTRD